MSDFFKVEIVGLDEKRAQLSDFQLQVNDAIAAGLQEGRLPIAQAMRTYPPQPPFMGAPTTREIHLYHQTGNYGQRITTPYIQQSGGYVTAEIDSGADYSIYLRGTPDGSYAGAWMHLGIWQPLFDILEQFLPGVSDAIERRIDALIERLGLS